MWATLGFATVVVLAPFAYYRTRGDESFIAYVSIMVVAVALMAGR